MEAFALYLLKSVAWLSSFALIFFLFLRNERFFYLNRIFLLSGIISSFVFPLLTLHYAVNIPVPVNIQSGEPVMAFSPDANYNTLLDGGMLLFALYLCGVLFVTSLIIKKSRSVLQTIKRASVINSHPVKLIRTPDYATAFSFFSYVFVNPSVTDIETKEIVNHELAHIRQKHWIDLVLVELLCVLQWFNPLIWIYIRFIRQNHEYLADEVALQHTSDPAVYRATLLNQIVGTPVVNLANSFNYSLNKKRFNMMKNIITSPYRKMKVFLILPVCAIILYAFAKPEYRYNYVTGSEGTANRILAVQNQVVKGTVTQEDGTPLSGATVLVKGTTTGTVTDLKGYFALDKIPADAELVVSFIGFQPKVIKAGKNSSEIKITMIRSVVGIEGVKIVPPPPPPPPPPANKGIEIKNNGETIPPPSGNIKNKSETQTVKKDPEEKVVKGVFVAVEEMPSFPGGYDALKEWISSNMKYPMEAAKNNVAGQVYVDFTVNSQGKVKDVKVSRPFNPLLDAEVVRVISNMPDWKPGKQNGKSVSVSMNIPINFSNEKVHVDAVHK